MPEFAFIEKLAGSEDGENVIAIGAAMYYINQAAVRL